SVQIEPKEVGEETMIAGAVDLQIALEFFVAVFGFAACGVVIVSGGEHDAGTGAIADNEASVGALSVSLGLDDHPACRRPSAGAIPEGIEQTLWLPGGCKVGLGLFEQRFAEFFENAVGSYAKGVIDTEPLANAIHPRHAITSIAANVDVHARPGLTQAPDQILQIVVGPQGRMHGARPQREDDRLIIVGTGDERGEILILIEVAVEQAQLLLAVSGVIDGVEVQREVLGWCGKRADELLDEDVAQPFQ